MKYFTVKTLLLTIAFASMAVSVPAARADQPNMEVALDHLYQAKAALERANIQNPHHGGHADEAIRRVNEAIDAVKEGIRHYREYH